MKATIASTIAILLAVAALSLSVFAHLNPPRSKKDFGVGRSADVVMVVQSVLTDDVALRAPQAYHKAHRVEILKTIEVAETSESGNYGIVFFRYSVGAEIFRDSYWVAKVNNKWYWFPNLEYADTEPTDKEWFEKMKERKEKWNEGSAKAKYE